MLLSAVVHFVFSKPLTNPYVNGVPLFHLCCWERKKRWEENGVVSDSRGWGLGAGVGAPGGGESCANSLPLPMLGLSLHWGPDRIGFHYIKDDDSVLTAGSRMGCQDFPKTARKERSMHRKGEGQASWSVMDIKADQTGPVREQSHTERNNLCGITQ